MTGDAGTLAQIRAELARVTYKPGWEFHASLTQLPLGATAVSITVDAVLPDSRMPNRQAPVQQTILVPAVLAAGELINWLRDALGWIELHERDEWLLVDGQRIHDPHQDAPHDCWRP